MENIIFSIEYKSEKVICETSKLTAQWSDEGTNDGWIKMAEDVADAYFNKDGVSDKSNFLINESQVLYFFGPDKLYEFYRESEGKPEDIDIRILNVLY